MKNWIAYIMLSGFIWFVVYLIIHSNKQEKENLAKLQKADQEKNKK